MTAFRCVAIETETAERFRRTGRDDAGNVLRHVVAQPGGSYPCRHCLGLAVPGEEMLLGSYNLPRPQGIYWTPSPIFLHADACPRFEADGEIAPIVRANPLVSVRAYDADDLCLYDLGHVCPGQDVDAPLDRALGDPRTAFVNVHTGPAWLHAVAGRADRLIHAASGRTAASMDLPGVRFHRAAGSARSRALASEALQTQYASLARRGLRREVGRG